jgi:hypothetical protein
VAVRTTATISAMRRVRTVPARTWLFVAAALITVLQYLGWQRVGDQAAAGVRVVARAIGPAISLGWPILLALGISAITGPWASRIAGPLRSHRHRLGESGMAGLTLAASAALGLLLACVLLFPRLLYPPLTQQVLNAVAPADRIGVEQTQRKLQNDARTTLLQGLGGAAVLLGVYFTFRQLRIARDGQVTERFTRAVDQLGNRSDDVQLGGVYALQQIGRASAEERGAIQEILAAYVRIHAPWNSQHDEGAVDVGAIPHLREWAPAVQAAMLALGRRDRATPVDPPLGLMGVNLRRIRLSDTDIPGGANLAAVLFWRSSLINAAIRARTCAGLPLGGRICGTRGWSERTSAAPTCGAPICDTPPSTAPISEEQTSAALTCGISMTCIERI